MYVSRMYGFCVYLGGKGIIIMYLGENAVSITGILYVLFIALSECFSLITVKFFLLDMFCIFVKAEMFSLLAIKIYCVT